MLGPIGTDIVESRLADACAEHPAAVAMLLEARRGQSRRMRAAAAG